MTKPRLEVDNFLIKNFDLVDKTFILQYNDLPILKKVSLQSTKINTGHFLLKNILLKEFFGIQKCKVNNINLYSISLRNSLMYIYLELLFNNILGLKSQFNKSNTFDSNIDLITINYVMLLINFYSALIDLFDLKNQFYIQKIYLYF